MTSRLRHLITLLGFSATSALLSAQVTLQFNGTVTNAHANHAFTNGDTVTFTIVLNDYSESVFGSVIDNESYSWTEEFTYNPILFTSLTGTGLDGAWTRPIANTISPANSLSVIETDSLSIQAGADAGASTGLTHNGLNFQLLSMTLALDGFDPVVGTTLPHPVDFMQTFLDETFGTTFSNGQFAAGGNTTYFSVSSVSVSAVPEQSTYAAILGGLALMAVASKRRSRGDTFKAAAG